MTLMTFHDSISTSLRTNLCFSHQWRLTLIMMVWCVYCDSADLDKHLDSWIISDRHQSDISRNIGPTSEFQYQSDMKMTYLRCLCRSRNEIFILHWIVDVVSAKEFHRPDSRTALDQCQSDIGRHIGPTWECWYRSDIKMAYFPLLCRCRN